MEETSGGVTEDRTRKSQIALTEYLMLYNEYKVFGSMRTRHRQGRGRTSEEASDLKAMQGVTRQIRQYVRRQESGETDQVRQRRRRRKI